MWIDGHSASAMEVLTGSLHNDVCAVVMGEQSFGKRLTQTIYGLTNGSGLVSTVAQYGMPYGDDIQDRGITTALPVNRFIPPSFVPDLKADTSKMDFENIKEQLSSKMCKVPDATWGV
jgi:C-terminal processing protease CtpA/Prc